MSLFNTIDIAATGLTAQRRRLDIVASNLSNVHTTRTEQGGPYQRMDPVFSEKLDEITGESIGVELADIARDDEPPKRIHDPSHPDADDKGYVALPNINTMEEMVNMITASRSYEANVRVIENAREMANKAINITV